MNVEPWLGMTTDHVLTVVLPVTRQWSPLVSALAAGDAGSFWLDFTSRRLPVLMGPKAGQEEEKSNTQRLLGWRPWSLGNCRLCPISGCPGWETNSYQTRISGANSAASGYSSFSSPS